MFVDGRYTLQVRDQVDGQLYEYKSVPQDSLGRMARRQRRQGRADRLRPVAAHARLGAERRPRRWKKPAPSWSRSSAIRSMRCGRTGPAPSAAPAFVQDEALAGRSSADKRGEVGEWLKAKKLDAAVISALDSVAWLLNIRGADVDRTPVALSYVIAHADGTADWFIAPEKVPRRSRRAARQRGARSARATNSPPRSASSTGKRVAADPERAVAAIFSALEAAGADAGAADRPGGAAQGDQERGRAGRPPRRAGARRRGGRAVPALALGRRRPRAGSTRSPPPSGCTQFRQDTGDLRDLQLRHDLAAPAPTARSSTTG